MASSLRLSPDELKALESVRTRWQQLGNSIRSFKEDNFQPNPPSVDSLNATERILLQNLDYANEIVAKNHDLFARTVVHPSTNYPGRTHEDLLLTLLRKKLEPNVEGAVEHARESATGAGIQPELFSGTGGGRRGAADEDSDEEGGYVEESDEDDENGGPREPPGLGDTWADTRDAFHGRMMSFIQEESSDLYTRIEREAGIENIRTGLKRSLEEEESDEEEEEDEDEDTEMADVGRGTAQQPRPGGPSQAKAPATQPEVLMWLAVNADEQLPNAVETWAKKAARAATGGQRMG